MWSGAKLHYAYNNTWYLDNLHKMLSFQFHLDWDNLILSLQIMRSKDFANHWTICVDDREVRICFPVNNVLKCEDRINRMESSNSQLPISINFQWFTHTHTHTPNKYFTARTIFVFEFLDVCQISVADFSKVLRISWHGNWRLWPGHPWTKKLPISHDLTLSWRILSGFLLKTDHWFLISKILAWPI